jgi:hypothetical protein
MVGSKKLVHPIVIATIIASICGFSFLTVERSFNVSAVPIRHKILGLRMKLARQSDGFR